MAALLAAELNAADAGSGGGGSGGACSKPDSESKALGARIERRKSYLPEHVVDFPLPPVGNIDVEPAKSL